jgi:hypothetical protein
VSRLRRPWRPPAGLVEDGRLPLSLSLGVNFSRPFVDQWARLEDTPLRGKFLKESLGFPEIEPAS